MSSQTPPKPSISYKDAGVDIDAGNALIDRIKHVAKRTSRPEVMGGLGGFGALCEIPPGYRQPVLYRARMASVLSCDWQWILASTTPSVSTSLPCA
jgi:hypothetical protein